MGCHACPMAQVLRSKGGLFFFFFFFFFLALGTNGHDYIFCYVT
jgi:hypothetical protein